MKRIVIFVSAAVVMIAAAVVFAQNLWPFQETLSGYEKVPAVSTVARGDFRAEIGPYDNSVNWQLSYYELEGNVTQAHIHFGQKGVNGSIVVFLCSNLGNGPAGTQPCPPSPASVSGTFRAADVGAGATAQGIAAGEFAELLKAIRAGMTYANVHSTKFPAGEVRSQIELPSVEVIRNGESSSGGHQH